MPIETRSAQDVVIDILRPVVGYTRASKLASDILNGLNEWAVASAGAEPKLEPAELLLATMADGEILVDKSGDVWKRHGAKWYMWTCSGRSGGEWCEMADNAVVLAMHDNAWRPFSKPTAEALERRSTPRSEWPEYLR